LDAFSFCIVGAFPTLDLAKQWIDSDEYKEALAIRMANTIGQLAITGSN
jgi:uncharacterized protein (DUF1330 family)